MNSKVSEQVAGPTFSSFSYGATLALGIAGGAASGAIVQTGPIAGIGLHSLTGVDADTDIEIRTTLNYVSSTTYLQASVAAYGPTRLGGAFRSASTAVVVVGALTGTAVGTSGTPSFFQSLGHNELRGTNNWVPIEFVEAGINGGAPVVGFAQIDFNQTGTSILDVWYSDTGAPVQMNGGIVTQIPEPSSLGLLALGAVGVLGRRRRQ